MSQSYSVSGTSTFTVTHAKHMAAKVATDLKRMQRLYGYPSDESIQFFELEVIELLKYGYLGTVTYGFRRDGQWIEPTLSYKAQELADGFSQDDDPGQIRPGADINGAAFYSYLTYSLYWAQLTESERENFENSLPFKRTGAVEPGINGYLTNDRTYSSGQRALNRASVRSGL